MKQLLISTIAAAALLAGTTACDQDTDLTELPGASMVSDRFTVVIDSSFTISARSILNPKVQSRTTTQLLGAIRAPEYGTLRADYVAQLFPSNAIDTVGVTPETIDSVKVQLVFEKAGFVGDSLAPIGFDVLPLTRQLPYPIYSDFNPDGYFNAEAPLGSGVFTAVGVSVNDTVAASAYRFAYAALPRQFGIDLFNKYKADPELFNDPNAFAQYFPGIYVRHSYGSGRVTRITDTRMMMYYHKHQRLANSQGVEVDSTTYHYAYYMATAPEMVANTDISLEISDRITAMADEGRAVLLSPAGRDIEMTFPISQIIDSYHATTDGTLSVINTMTFQLPCDSIANGRGINPPGYLLMVLSKDKDKFFAENQLPDNVTSFVATLDYPTMTYTFGDLRAYLIDALEKEELKPEDYTFTLTPVAMVTENTSSSYYYDYYYGGSSTPTLSGISPMVALPSMVEILPEKAKIKLTYSKQLLQ